MMPKASIATNTEGRINFNWYNNSNKSRCFCIRAISTARSMFSIFDMNSLVPMGIKVDGEEKQERVQRSKGNVFRTYLGGYQL